MKENFASSLSAVLLHEGGFSDHPLDKGGATMKGVTQAVYDEYRKRNGLSVRTVASISDTELQAIYRKQYWDAVKGDELPSGVDYCVFDFAVNSGPSRAAKFLQTQLGVTADGVIGPITLREAGEADPKALINRICDARMEFLRNLSTFSTFGKGWTNRVNGVRSKSLAMTANPLPSQPEQQESTMLNVVLPFLMPILRHALTTLAGILVTYGVIQAGQQEAFIAIIVGVVSWALGQGMSLLNAKKT